MREVLASPVERSLPKLKMSSVANLSIPPPPNGYLSIIQPPMRSSLKCHVPLPRRWTPLWLKLKRPIRLGARPLSCTAKESCSSIKSWSKSTSATLLASSQLSRARPYRMRKETSSEDYRWLSTVALWPICFWEKQCLVIIIRLSDRWNFRCSNFSSWIKNRGRKDQSPLSTLNRSQSHLFDLFHFQNNDEINIMILYYLDWSAALLFR